MILPEGYSLKFEPHFTFLYCGAEEIAVFLAKGATTEKIEDEAWKHYKEKEER